MGAFSRRCLERGIAVVVVRVAQTGGDGEVWALRGQWRRAQCLDNTCRTNNPHDKNTASRSPKHVKTQTP